MRKLFAFAAVLLFTALQLAAQTTAQPGVLINGPERVIQKPVYGEFVGGELKNFLAPTRYRIELRTNTADGNIVTVLNRHPWFNYTVCQFRSKANLRIEGDDSSGYIVQDDDRVYMRLEPSGYRDEFLVHWN